MQARRTEKAVERYAPNATRCELHDTHHTGLSLRVTEKGRARATPAPVRSSTHRGRSESL